MAQGKYRQALSHPIRKNMSSLNLQFHALSAELVDLLLAATQDEKIHFVILESAPFSARAVAPDDLRNEVVSPSSGKMASALYLMRTAPDLSPTMSTKFYDRNPGGIVVDIGARTPGGLKQSRLSTITDDLLTLALAKKIAKALRKFSKSGVTAVNAETGAKHLNKSSRYTEGAKELEESGCPMLPFAGGGKLVLGDLAASPGGVTSEIRSDT